MLKLFTIVGARPQFIKAATVSRAIRQHFSEQIQEFIIHTGQHYDRNMSEAFFQELEIPEPYINLGIGVGTGAEQLREMKEQLVALFTREKPDWVLVYGDTTSTLAGAEAAVHCGIRLAHVEAGLRSYDNSMPEERNRVRTDRLSDILFCPTEQAVENLKKEGIEDGGKVKVLQVGDVMYDSVKYYAEKEKADETSEAGQVLLTLHRAGNTDNQMRFISLVNNVLRLAEEKEVRVLWPVHPRIKAQLEAHFPQLAQHAWIRTVAPMGYLETLKAQREAVIGITDSGGVQKELYLQGRPSLILRSETEWTEIVEDGKAICVDADYDELKRGYDTLAGKFFTPKAALYGDGSSAIKICEALIGS